MERYYQRWRDEWGRQYGRNAYAGPGLTYEILHRIQRAAMAVQSLRPRAREGLAIPVTRDEMILLERNMARQQFVDYFGPEGALLSFQGVPLVVT